jgi:FAD:protein FMN transferase
MLDLGAVGKGYAMERASELLREAGITSALLNGGTSTVCALGHPPDQEHWKIAIESPPKAGSTERPPLLATVALRDEALSVSAVWGKSFQAEGRTFGHVLDPRTGQPVNGPVLAAVVLPSAMETDALSTALLVLGEAGQEELGGSRPGLRTLVASTDSSAAGFRVEGRGIAVQSQPSMFGQR